MSQPQTSVPDNSQRDGTLRCWLRWIVCLLLSAATPGRRMKLMPTMIRRDARRLVSLAIRITIGVFAAQVTSHAASNPIAAYSFDEGSGTTANDSSGSNYAGALKNGP